MSRQVAVLIIACATLGGWMADAETAVLHFEGRVENLRSDEAGIQFTVTGLIRRGEASAPIETPYGPWQQLQWREWRVRKLRVFVRRWQTQKPDEPGVDDAVAYLRARIAQGDSVRGELDDPAIDVSRTDRPVSVSSTRLHLPDLYIAVSPH